MKSNFRMSNLLISLIFLQNILSPSLLFSGENNFQAGGRDKVFAVHSIDARTGWAVGNQGLVLKTGNGGKSWEKVALNLRDDLNDITFIEREGWIVGGEGLILHSADGGESWVKQDSGLEISLLAVKFLDRGRGFVIGESGAALKTEDGGRTWEALDLDWVMIVPDSLLEKGVIAPNLYDIYFSNNTYGWIVGDNGVVLFSSDGGKEWEVERIGSYPPLFSSE